MINEEELFDKYISASMTAAERESLKELLKDEAAGQRFRDFVEETGLYISLAEQTQMHENLEQRKSLRVTKNRITQNNIKVGDVKKPLPFRTVVVAAAAALIIGALTFLTVFNTKNTIGYTESLTAVTIERAIFDLGFGDQTKLMDGDSITALENKVKLILDDGSELVMDQGASCQIVKNDNGFDVSQKRGRVEYNIEKQLVGNNFEVLTNDVRTTVIGTRFTVEATGHKEKVRVLEGLVKVDNYQDITHFINPGEFAMTDENLELSKAMALTGMKLNEIVINTMGDDFHSESLEEKPYILVFYAEEWDPSSKTFIHRLKDFYKQYKGSFEVVFVNDKEGFANEFEMPWPLIKPSALSQAEEILNVKASSFPLNVVLIDQHGTTLARSVANNEWLGIDHVLDAVKSNALK